MDKKENRIKFGDKRFITGLFLDIMDFTTLSENMDPEEVDDIINLYFDVFSNIIERNGGWIEKYIGDAIFAVFGKNIASTFDSYKACLSALQIINALKKLNKNQKYKINIRIGIHSGIVAKSKRGQYEVLVGDTVNTASRIQHLANKNEILISSSILKNINEFFKTEYKGIFSLKGKQEKIQIFKLIDFKKDIEKIPEKEKIFERKEIKTFLKYFLNNINFITIYGERRSGKSYFIYNLFYILKDITHTNILFLSFDPIKKIDLFDFLKKILFELNQYTEYSNGNNSNYKKKNIKKNIDSIIKNFNFNKLNKLTNNQLILEIIEIFENLNNFSFLIDNFNYLNKELINFLHSEKFINILEENSIFFITSSDNFKYKNSISVNNFDYNESVKFINFTLKRNLAETVENKIIALSNNNIGILSELLTIYNSNKQIDLNSNIENIYLEIIDNLEEIKKIILYILSLSITPIFKNTLHKILLTFYNNINLVQFNKVLEDLEKLNLIKNVNLQYYIESKILKEIINKTILKKNKKLIYNQLFINENKELLKFFYAKLSNTEYYLDFNKVKNESNIDEIVNILNILFTEIDTQSEEIVAFIKDVSKIFLSLNYITQFKIELDMDKFINISKNNNLQKLTEFLDKNIIDPQIFNNNLINSVELDILYLFIHKYDEFKKKSFIYFTNINDNFKINEFATSISIFQYTKYLKINPLNNNFEENIKFKISKFFINCAKLLYLIGSNFLKQYNEILQLLNTLEKITFDIDYKLFYEIYYFYFFFIMFISEKTEFIDFFNDISNNIAFFREEFNFLNLLKNSITKIENDYNISISNFKLLPVQITTYFILLNTIKNKKNAELVSSPIIKNNILKSIYIEFEKSNLEIQKDNESFLSKTIIFCEKIFHKLL